MSVLFLSDYGFLRWWVLHETRVRLLGISRHLACGCWPTPIHHVHSMLSWLSRFCLSKQWLLNRREEAPWFGFLCMNLTYLPTSLTHSCIMFGGTRRSTVARTRLAKINIFWILLYYERTRRRVETWIGWVYVWTDNHTFLHNNVFGTVCSGPHFSSVQTTKSYLLVTYRLSMKLKLVETSFDFSVSNWTSALESLEGNDHQNVGQASPFQPKHG